VTNTIAAVASMAFSPDGRTLAVGGDDVILWDVTDPTQSRRLGLPLANPGVVSVVFSPDGRTVAAGNRDGSAILWDLTGLNQVRDHVVERACLATRGGLDRAEWGRYVPDLPYQDTCPA
jgi:WD40 repeat protein